MIFTDVLKNPLVLAVGNELLNVIVPLVKSFVIPKIKRVAFEKMGENLQHYAEFVLEQKEKVEKTESEVDDETYKLSKEAFKVFLDQANHLYQKM